MFRRDNRPNIMMGPMRNPQPYSEIQSHSEANTSEVAHLLPLGKPTTKRKVNIIDLFAVLLSLICLILGVAAVANEKASWYLGQGTRQLVVIGFLLSIMNLCLASVAPTLFLLLEARFGESRLQNYEGILRNQIFATRVNIIWRGVLGLMVALPIGLSVAYKTFSGGESVNSINARTFLGNGSYYGMFAPPGLQSISQSNGLSIFFNATSPFASATGSELPLPVNEQTYGYNLVLIDGNSTALLDIPHPDYISTVQARLAIAESWNVTATVFATVATLDRTKDEDLDSWSSDFVDFCEAAKDSSGAFAHQSFAGPDKAIVLIAQPSPGNQTSQYIGITPDPGILYESSCKDLPQYVQLYEVNRQQCKGTWSITRGSIQLVNGACSGKILPEEQQIVITDNNLFLPVWYMPSLGEFLGQFASTRNQSSWARPYFATAVAAMVWSRMTATSSIAKDEAARTAYPGSSVMWYSKKGLNLTYEQAGLIYQVDDSVLYSRPTLRKSPLLYFVLAVQPLMLVAILIGTALLHSVPLGKGFGLIAILSGINRDTLDSLSGATLSGEIRKNVKLVMRPTQSDDKAYIEYSLMPAKTPASNGRVLRKAIYH